MRLRININTPIRRNLIAFAFGIMVNMLSQFVLVPFYLSFWGVKLYSDWLVLGAVSSFFFMSDAGLNIVIQNRYSIKYAEGDFAECRSLLANNIVLISGLGALIVLLSLAFVFSENINEVMHIRGIPREQASAIFLVLIATVFVRMYSGVLNAIYRAVSHYDRALFLDQLAVLLVFALTLIGLIAKVSLVGIALLGALPYLLLIAFKAFDVRRIYSDSFSLRDFDWSLLKKLISPSLSYLSFPVGSALILQGYTLLINRYYGADSVVLYNTTRTLCNFIKTILLTIQNSVWPEFSLAYGASNYPRMRQLHRKAVGYTLLGAVCLSIGVLALGSTVFYYWTNNQVSFDYTLVAMLVLVICCECLWSASSMTLVATNKHIRLGLYYLVISAFAFLFSWLLSIYLVDLHQLAMSMLVVHIPMWIISITLATRLTGDRLSSFWGSFSPLRILSSRAKLR